MMSQIRKLHIVTDFRDKAISIARSGKLKCLSKQTF